MLRIVLGILAGCVIGIACVAGIELLGHIVFPTPAGFDLSNPADVERLMAVLPLGAFLFVIAGWFLGALIGAVAANWIARRAFAGWIVALLILVGGVYTMIVIPHPLGMWVAGIVLPLAAAWLAQRLTASRPASAMS